MPAQSRAQRKRQNARQAARSNTAPPVQVTTQAPVLEEHGSTDTAHTATVSSSAIGTRQARQARRPVSRPAPEPVDYSHDYNSARQDLLRIMLWAGLLFVAMVVIRLTGIL